MNSIKNAIVTVTLLAVGYGSYVVLQDPSGSEFSVPPADYAGRSAPTAAPLDTPDIQIEVPKSTPRIDAPVAITAPQDFAPEGPPVQRQLTIAPPNIEVPELTVELNPPTSPATPRNDSAEFPGDSEFASSSNNAAQNHVDGRLASPFASQPSASNDVGIELPPIPELKPAAETQVTATGNNLQAPANNMVPPSTQDANPAQPTGDIGNTVAANPFATPIRDIAPNNNELFAAETSTATSDFSPTQAPPAPVKPVPGGPFAVAIAGNPSQSFEPSPVPQPDLPDVPAGSFTATQTANAINAQPVMKPKVVETVTSLEVNPAQSAVAASTAIDTSNNVNSFEPKFVQPDIQNTNNLATNSANNLTNSATPDRDTGDVIPVDVDVSLPTSKDVAAIDESVGPIPPENEDQGSLAFERVWNEVQTQLASHQLVEALKSLSPWAIDTNLNPEQSQRCLQLLDQLAGTVLYSRESFLEPPYVVQAGETLDEIAQRYAVPEDLLAKINGIAPPFALSTGEKMKVVRGPFRAVVSLKNQEMTLYAGNDYAGRFALKIGRDLPPEHAFYEIAEKSNGRSYFDRRLGREVLKGDPENRYGHRWLGLRGEHITTGHSVGIHGRPTESIESASSEGSISLDARDIEDIFSILGVGSRVEVRPE